MERTHEELFAALVREHEPRLFGFVRACVHDSAAAEDLVQDTFVTAWHRLDQYDPTRPFGAWLHGIAKNRIRGYLRSRAHSRPHIRVASPEAAAAIADEFEQLSKPSQFGPDHECFAALRECLRTLGADDREIVERAYRENQTCRIIADHLGRTVEWTKKRLQRARAQLRDCILAKVGVETAHG